MGFVCHLFQYLRSRMAARTCPSCAWFIAVMRLINFLVEAITPFVGPDAPGEHDLALNDPNPYSPALIAA